jgi:hypothetical protein
MYRIIILTEDITILTKTKDEQELAKEIEWARDTQLKLERAYSPTNSGERRLD